jgi:outer membrane PBP1 activator LpoA protein
MVQRLFAFLCLIIVLIPATQAASEAITSTLPQSATTAKAEKRPQKTAEEYYLDGLACLKASDTNCAIVPLAAINPASPYAKLLGAQIAGASSDFDTPLRLLIPLQAEAGLLPQAYASLHATLALAYEAQENVLNALEQRVKAEPFIGDKEAVADNQIRIWKQLSSQAKEALVEMRGESPDPVVQGWVDLALAVAYADRKSRNIEQWRKAYPDHPAGDALLSFIAEATVAVNVPDATTAFRGKIALLLPLESAAYSAAAKAVQAGFMAAHAADTSEPEVVVYVTGDAEATLQAYRRATAEGARIVVGPLTRDEVTALSTEKLTVQTLALNQPEGNLKPQDHLIVFGLPAEAEARQVARLARDHGMQNALIVVADNPLAQRMAKAFSEEWHRLDGNISLQLSIPASDNLANFKAEAAAHPSDMIFLASSAPQARLVRPYLDQAIPTYGTSHLYDGISRSVQNLDLVAVHFVDMPWLVDPDNPDFSAFERSGSAELQRLFALGLDSYRLLPLLAERPVVGKKLLDGATGGISMSEGGLLARELPMAQFRREGIALENLP